jgi:hypothetical protein
MTTSSASITRDSSPPDAPLPSGRGSLPGCGLNSARPELVARRDLDDDLGSGHGEGAQLGADTRREVGPGGAAQITEDACPPLGLGPQLGHVVVEVRESVVVAVELDQASAAVVEHPDDVVEGGAVLADEPGQVGTTRLHRLEFDGHVGVEGAEVARQA